MKTKQEKRSSAPGSQVKPPSGKPNEKRHEAKGGSETNHGNKKVEAKKSARGK